MNGDQLDALMDQLLREILGGDRPRDMTTRLMARAKLYDRTRHRWWLTAASSLAACIALGTLLYFYNPPTAYPAPIVTAGSVELPDAEHLQPGAKVVTTTNAASVTLGGYINFDMAPETVLTLGGRRYAEQVLMEKGKLDVQVTKKKGTFDILVGPAAVHVMGTKFHLEVSDGMQQDQIGKLLQVHVDEGKVIVHTPTGDEELTDEMDSSVFVPLRRVVWPPAQPIMQPKQPPVTIPTPTPDITGNPPKTSELQLSQTLPAARSNNGRGAMQSTLSIKSYSVLQVPPAGRFMLPGIVRKDHDLYLLETPRATFLLFPQQQPPAGFNPQPDTRIRVIWENGKYLNYVTVPKDQ